MTERCQAVASGTKERCQLGAGHNSPHRHEADWHVLTWEPAYVGDLRRALEDGPWRWRALLEDVLQEVGPNLRSEAIDDAREALRKDTVVPPLSPERGR